jgi:hypothetical protein
VIKEIDGPIYQFNRVGNSKSNKRGQPRLTVKVLKTEIRDKRSKIHKKTCTFTEKLPFEFLPSLCEDV